MWKHFLTPVNTMKSIPRWRKVRISQTVVAVTILILLVSMSVYYSWPAPSKANTTAVKLSIVINPVSEVEISVIVSAVDESGKVDTTRNDVVELHFEGTTTAQLAQSRVTLKNGQVNVGIKVHSQQSSFLTAKWVDGPTPLKDTTVLVSPLMWNY
jgi:hypothetical protein